MRSITKSGQAICLLGNEFRRQLAAGIPIARAVIPSECPGMIRLMPRHRGEHLTALSSVHSSGINLKPLEAKNR